MPKKSLVKKRAWQAGCRRKVLQGLINDVDGGWVQYQEGKAMHASMLHGYKLGHSKKRRSGRAKPDELD